MAKAKPNGRLSGSKTQSRVTNGRCLFVEKIDARLSWPRRFRDIHNGIASDLGGVEEVSAAQLQLVRRAAMLAIMCERLEGEITAREGSDTLNNEHYLKLVGLLGRTLAALGLERIAPDDQPGSVDAYLERNHGSARAPVPT